MEADLVSLYIMGILFIIYFAFSLPAVMQVYFSKAIDRYVERKLKKQNPFTKYKITRKR